MTEVPNAKSPSTKFVSKMSPPEMTSSDNKEAGGVDVESHDTNEYVTGYKLSLIVGSVALACFLMLLDTMVISTASRLFLRLVQIQRNLH
jgi:hypothetical protein